MARSGRKGALLLLCIAVGTVHVTILEVRLDDESSQFIRFRSEKGYGIVILIAETVLQLTHAQVQTFRDVDDLCLACICQASTGCQPKPCADLGGTTFCGPYQISRAYWLDAGQPAVNQGSQSAFEECAVDETCSANSVRRYLIKYARNCNRDSLLDCEDIARLHKAGPFACEQPALEATPYWKGFLDCWYGKKK